MNSLARTLLLFVLSTFTLAAAKPWPGIKYAEVRAYAWPDDKTTQAVILPGMTLKPGVLNKDGAPLTPDQIKRLITAATVQGAAGAIAGCYIPHNAFVFYDAKKKPVAFVEVCFMCRATRIQPKVAEGKKDLLALATIFDELKLPMGEYPNLAAFKKEYDAPTVGFGESTKESEGK